MKEWLETGMYQVKGLLCKDTDFQSLLEQLAAAQENFQTVTKKLPPEDLQIIENYLALCEEAECQKTMTAYYCGKRNG